MTTGPHHYNEAEKLLEAAKTTEMGSPTERYYLSASLVHATLAHAAATAAAFAVISDAEQRADADQWREILGIIAEDAIERRAAAAEAELLEERAADGEPRPCLRRNPHTPHRNGDGTCYGIAPEFPSERVEVVAAEAEGDEHQAEQPEGDGDEHQADAGQLERRAEPLVTCGDTSDEGATRCILPIGHPGPHDDGRVDATMWAGSMPDELGPEPCKCLHPHRSHANRALAGQPRGVCLTSCGCLVYRPASAADEPQEPIALARPYIA